ncbi:nuclear pore complex protein Nup155-like [Centruroides sculpturatus]|uniref:nuclear pore complex protein Nup155-like n=1 Tax=Centruroides sculpturatus TaxID=218467 RepID=UPI000C6E95D5|nr:nuclear pore complex protein Nup155-like [Centruroides sculpturatus]
MAVEFAPNPSSAFNISSQQKEALEIAARMVDAHLQMDSSYTQLIDLLKGTSGIPSVSGLTDQDYPGVTGLGSSLKSLSQVKIVNRVPLPVELVEQFGHMQSNCQMGLFTDIERAWLTIDSDIFIWRYEDGGDLAYFDGLSETILSVNLVRPKPGIFLNHVSFLLCLTTPVEIVLLGVSFNRQQENAPVYEEMHLLAEPLFSIPTDNSYMLTISGIHNGRIFMGGKDGCLYELAYQARDGWFSRKCQKINHSSSYLSFLVPSFLNFAFSEEDPIVQIEIDNSRYILYTRSEKGGIQVFDLGNDGKQTSRVTGLSQNAIVEQAVHIAKTIDRSHFHPIVHISSVELPESFLVHLVAITQTGVRLYFTTTSLIHPEIRPVTLSLLHVRLPPGFSANAPPDRPSNVHLAHYRKGTALLASARNDDSDILWAMSNDTFPFQPILMEIHTILPITGRTWAMAEVPILQPPKPFCPMVFNNINVYTEPPLLVTQHMEYPRQFVLLSETQACATCLILACSNLPQDKQVANWATLAFFRYGGEPHITFPAATGPQNPVMTPHSPLYGLGSRTAGQVWSSTPAVGNPVTSPAIPVSPVMPVGAFDHSQQPFQPQSTLQTSAMPVTGPEIVYSGKHNGLFLYFSRILRPIWNVNIVSNVPSKNEQNEVGEFLASNVNSTDISIYLEKLKALRDFVQDNSQFSVNMGASNINPIQNLPQRVLNYIRPDCFNPSEANQMQQQLQKKSQAEAEIQERASLVNLHQLIHYTCEVLGLWKVLCDHQFHVISNLLTPELKTQIKSMIFRDLIISGKEVTTALVNALINLYLDDNATTDAISNRLREVCPSIYRNEDALFSKAHEKLLSAKTIQNNQERENILKESLQLCKQISSQLNLRAVCVLFQAVHYYDGIVDLCLSAAQKRDPQNIALHYYNNGEPPDDNQGLQAYLNRMECYKSVMEVLGQLLSITASHPQAPNVPKSPGPPASEDYSLLTPEEAKSYVEHTFQIALKCGDELFHVALYDWLIECHQMEKLLEIKSPYLERYLKRCNSVQPNNIAYIDLMWKYYEKNHSYAAAARILAKLADKHGTEINLQQRIQYLAHAIMCIKSSEMRITASGEGEFLHELEEKMEVARIQQRIFEMLQQRSDLRGVPDALSRLNADLLDITELFEKFAHPFDLPECELAIIHCAGHYDPTLVENLWQRIIDREINATANNTTQTRMEVLANKLKSLGKIYILSQKYFPLAFLIRYLEEKLSSEQFDVKWTFTTLLSIGVPLPQLLDVYHRLYKSKVSSLHIKRPLHLLHVLCQLLNTYVDNPKSISQSERRQLTTQCLDMVACYLVDVQSMNDSDPAIQNLTSELRSVQYKLERIT